MSTMPHSVTKACAILLVLTAFASFIHALAGFASLQQLHSLLAPFSVKTGTGLLFMLFGIALLPNVPLLWQRGFQRISAIKIFLYAMLQLALLLLTEPLSGERTVAPAIAGMQAALKHATDQSFSANAVIILSALALLLMRRPSAARHASFVRLLANTILLVAMAALAANLLDIKTLYAISGYERVVMSAGMAVGMGIVSIGLRTELSTSTWNQSRLINNEGKRILATGSLLQLAVGLAVAVMAVSTFSRSTKAEAVKQLAAALSKQNELFDTVLNQSIAEAHLISRNGATLRQFRNLARHIDEKETLKQVQNDAELFSLRGFSSIRYYTAEGALIHAVGGRTLHTLRTIDLNAAVPAELMWDEGFVIRTRIKIVDENNQLTGIIESEKKLLKLTLAYMQPRPPGGSFDSMICGVVDDGLVGCFPSIWNQQVVLYKPRTEREKLPIDYALEHQTGMRTATDYRGQDVASTYGPIGTYNLAGITKIDFAELYAPTRALLEELLIVVCGLLILGLMILYNRVNPLLNMLDTARETARTSSRKAVEREARIQAVVDHVHDGIITMSSTGVIMTANHAVSRIFGRSEDYLIGQHFNTLVSTEHHAFIRAMLADALSLAPIAAQQPESVLLKSLPGGARDVFFELRTSRIMLGGEDVLIGIIHDVTEAYEAGEALKTSEEYLRTIADNVPVLIGYVSKDQRYQFVNHQYENWFSAQKSDILGKTARELFGDEAYAIMQPRIEQVLRGEVVKFEVSSLTRNYPEHAEITYLPSMDAAGQVKGYYVLAIDATTQRRVEATLEKEREMLELILETIDVGVVACDTQGNLSLSNRSSREFLGLPIEKSASAQWLASCDLYQADGVTRLQTTEMPLFRALHGEALKDLQIEACTPQGVARKLAVSGRKLSTRAGQDLGAVVVMSDITAIKAYEDKLEQLARFDALTGLANRGQFNEKIIESVNRSMRSGQGLAVLYLDIDHFKNINDTYGHHAGDLVLKQFALRLQDTVRKTDIVARLGGDEFVILLESNSPASEVPLVAQKILDAMEPDFELEANSIQISTSIGIAIRENDENEYERLLRRADNALYQAKSTGRKAFRIA